MMNKKRGMLFEEMDIIPKNFPKNLETINFDVIYNLPALDKYLRLFVPALFSKIEIIGNKEIFITVPYSSARKVVNYLKRHYRAGIPLKVKVIGE